MQDDDAPRRLNRRGFLAGATVAAWYPITPSTSLVDAFSKYCERLRIDPETGTVSNLITTLDNPKFYPSKNQ